LDELNPPITSMMSGLASSTQGRAGGLFGLRVRVRFRVRVRVGVRIRVSAPEHVSHDASLLASSTRVSWHRATWQGMCGGPYHQLVHGVLALLRGVADGVHQRAVGNTTHGSGCT